jgi:RNA polymerase sigma-70 factor (ECF subfamily)
MFDENAAAADRRTMALYQGGDEAATREVSSWIQAEIGARYSLLRDEMEDLSQAVHAKLLANLQAGRFQGRSSLRTYVTSITHHTAVDRIRQIYRERAFTPGWAPAAEPVERKNPYESMASLQEETILHLTLQRSPQACKDLWRLVFLERLSTVEVGRRLSLPPGTVKSRMWYCRRKVLALLETIKRSLRGAGRTVR